MPNPVSTNLPIGPAPVQIKGSNSALKTEDFIKLLVQQLQNQDPLEPMKNEQLLAQVTQIGTLQSQQSLQSSLQSNQSALQSTLTALVVQNQIGQASNVIGQTVTGTDDDGGAVTGTVTSVRVEQGVVRLELDTGKTLQMGNVVSISKAA